MKSLTKEERFHLTQARELARIAHNLQTKPFPEGKSVDTLSMIIDMQARAIKAYELLFKGVETPGHEA